MYVRGRIIINEVDQLLYYFLLPKFQDDPLNINMPLIVNEKIDEWLDSSQKVDLFLDAMNNKYTFRDSIVDREVRCDNRYGMPCRDVFIKYGTMFYGYQKRSN